MPRSVAAYLADIVEACDAIDSVLEGIDLNAYLNLRAVHLATLRRECAEMLARVDGTD